MRSGYGSVFAGALVGAVLTLSEVGFAGASDFSGAGCDAGVTGI